MATRGGGRAHLMAVPGFIDRADESSVKPGRTQASHAPYASMGVPEFWRYNGQDLRIYTLQEAQYVECDRSPTFPWMQKEYLYNFLEEAQQDEIAAEVKFRAFVKENL